MIKRESDDLDRVICNYLKPGNIDQEYFPAPDLDQLCIPEFRQKPDYSLRCSADDICKVHSGKIKYGFGCEGAVDEMTC